MFDQIPKFFFTSPNGEGSVFNRCTPGISRGDSKFGHGFRKRNGEAVRESHKNFIGSVMFGNFSGVPETIPRIHLRLRFVSNAVGQFPWRGF